MGILANLLNPPDIRAYAPHDDFWYSSATAQALSGVSVNPDTALSISTVFRCVSAIAQDIAGMPLIVYQRTDGGKERAVDHPLYEVLHDRPNQWQTSFEWREMMLGHLLLRGNAYNLIEPGPRGFAGELIPLNPAEMKVEQLANRQLRYTYTWKDRRKEIFTQDEIFHLRGLSSDGIKGLSVVGLARESLGLGIAAEQYGARFFAQDARPGGVLSVPNRLSPESHDQMKKDWSDVHSGLLGSHKTAILENGVKWEQVGMSNEDAQFLATRGLQIEETARWFGVPLHRIGHTQGVTSWGTGIEQFTLGYIKFTLLGWVRRLEGSIKRDLILDPKTFYAAFLMDHLMRGDITSRFSAYRIAVTTGWMSRNEVRRLEDMNSADGLDEYLVPQNMASIDEAGDVRRLNEGPGQPSQRSPAGFDARARLLAQQAAERIVRKELRREGMDWDAHAGWVAEVLNLDLGVAKGYVTRVKGLFDTGLLEETASERIAELAALALEEEGATQ